MDLSEKSKISVSWLLLTRGQRHEAAITKLSKLVNVHTWPLPGHHLHSSRGNAPPSNALKISKTRRKLLVGRGWPERTI